MNEHSSALRPVMIYGAILASAVLIGLTLTAEMDYKSLGFLAIIFALLASPLLLRYHLLLLFGFWQSGTGLNFLPGMPPMWLVCGAFSLVLVCLERSFFRDREFVNVPAATRALLAFGVVVVITMLARGGIGIQWLGSGELAGGRKYLFILGAIVAYFALSLKGIPAERANLFVGLYFLGGVLAFIGPLAGWLGPPFERLQYFFHPAEGIITGEGTFRVKGLAPVGMGLVGWLLSRYGFGGVFHQGQIWRTGLLFLGLALGLLSGYRTQMVLYAVTLSGLFWLEGWHRTRWLWGWLILAMVMLAVIVPLTPHLPTPIQRTLAFLPLPVDPVVRYDAQGTMDWRYELFASLANDVPRYFWRGKGMAISARDMEWAETLTRFGGHSWDYAYITGEHHNGFFSVIIAFGIWGLVAFVAFIAIGWRVLLQNYRFGEPRLRSVNAFLLLYYSGWVVLFFSFFGTLYWSFRDFAGILALGVALNGGLARAPEPAEAETRELPARTMRPRFHAHLR